MMRDPSAIKVVTTDPGSHQYHLLPKTPKRQIINHSPNMKDPSKKWLLTIPEPLVFKNVHLMHSRGEWEWRRLMGKLVEIHLSVPITEQALTACHRSGDLATVLIFASTVPFVWDRVARFLILTKVDCAGQVRWKG